MSPITAFAIGVLVGAAIAIAITLLRRRHEARFAQQLLEETQKDKETEISALLDQIKTAFSALSRDALSANSDDFLKLARTRLEQQTVQGDQQLESKKKLIDARLDEVNRKLAELNGHIQVLEKHRSEAYGALKGQLQKTTEATSHLQQTTQQLREALAHPRRRGQWGERMADDVLRLAGFVEGVNYAKQTRVESGTIPDFTFFLPDGLVVHMDVKFPLANYLKMLDAEAEGARATATRDFLRDVRLRVKEITSRDYIDPAGGTVDYCLVFIPNEQIYGFIHQQDSTLLDDALKSKVVLCSPLTLYAILSVIRQGVENFRFARSATRILELLGQFRKQWDKYVESMTKMGDRLDAAMREYQHLVTTRTRQLDRELDKIDDLQAQQRESEASSKPIEQVEQKRLG